VPASDQVPRHQDERAAAAQQVPNKIVNLACSARSQDVEEGQVVEVSSTAKTLRSPEDVAIRGQPAEAIFREPVVASHRYSRCCAGNYVVSGRPYSRRFRRNDCEVAFHVIAKPVIALAPRYPAGPGALLRPRPQRLR